MATLQGKAVKNTYRQVLQIGANNVGVSGSAQRVQDGAGVNTALSLSTIAATIHGDLTITGDLIITGGGIQIQDLIDDTVATLIQNGTGITWAYNDGARTLTPTITIATADGGVQGDFLQFNTGANEASAVGKIKWNVSDGTMDIGLIGGNVVLQVGQEEVARVLNNSGTNFTEAGYQAVRITSAQGQRLAVGLAQGNNNANSKNTLGLVTENIANNQEGFITTSGLVRQIDTTGDLQTEVWVDGDTLYLSPTAPGAVTKVKPIAPQQVVVLGFVVYAHKTQGKIYVKVDNGYDLTELHDVKITSVANNNILKYNSSTALWENVAGTTTNISEGTNLYYTQARFDSAFAAKTTTNLTEGANLYFTTARGDANFATNFATKTTTNLPEGSNLYYTNTRARTALSITAGTGIDYNNTTGVFALSAIPNASLTNSSVTVNSLSLALGASITLTTTNIAEGTNLYWTDARFDSRFGTKTTTNLAEGSNLYYTQARFNTAFTAKSTTDLAEGTNLYYTDARSRAAISESAVGLDYSSGSGVLSLTAGYAIPTTVKLGQYDTAYNRSIVSAAVSGTTTKTLSLTQQDANVVSATWTDLGITTINGTANQITATTVANTTTLAFTNDVTMPNNLVVSGNLTINGTATYVNTQSISAKDPLFEVANDNNTTDVVDIGYYGRFYDSAQTRVEFTGLFRDASDAGKFKFFTGLVDEPTNVVNTSGVGYTVGTLVANFEGNLAGTANAANALSTARTIAASGDATWSVSFDGSTNATAALTLANTGVTASTYGTTTAVPTIAIDGKGRITSASNTNIAFPVTTVNGASGTVVLTTSNIAEGSNQYFTTARAQSAISGTSPISVASGVVSISQSGTATNGYLSSTDWNTFNDKSPAAGSASITTLGTIATGVWNGTSIGSAYGGTGFNSYTVGDILYASGASTLSKLADVATGNALISGGVGIAPSWGKIGLATHVSGTLPVANGGTGIATLTAGYIPFGNGTSAFNSSANLFWDSTNNRFGIGTNSPSAALHVAAATAPFIRIDDIGFNSENGITWQPSGFTSRGSLTLNYLTAEMRLSAGVASSTYFQTFYTAGVERMRIAANGNIGVGSGSTIYNGGGFGRVISIYEASTVALSLATSVKQYQVGISGVDNDFRVYDSTRSSYIFSLNGSNGNCGIGTITPFNIASVNLTVNGSSSAIQLGVSDVRTAQLYADNTQVRLYAVADYPLKFGTNDTERVRITNAGYLKASNTGTYADSGGGYHEFLSNTANSYTTFFINTAASPASTYITDIQFRNSTPNNTSARFINCDDATNNKAIIYSDGTFGSRTGTYGSIISDEKYKTEIQSANSQWDDIKNLRVVNFKFKEDVELEGEKALRQIGFIAQEVEKVSPNLVYTATEKDSEETWKSVKTSIIEIKAIKALQEAMERIEILEAKMAILEAK